MVGIIIILACMNVELCCVVLALNRIVKELENIDGSNS